MSQFGLDGNHHWTRTWGSTERDYGYAVVVDGTNSAYITGFFQDTADFDPGPGVEEHTSIEREDVFLIKILSDGYW